MKYILYYIKKIYKYIIKNVHIFEGIKWVPYYQIKGLKKIAEGGFGIVYKAIWKDETVAVKRFNNSQNMIKYFLNEVKRILMI